MGKRFTKKETQMSHGWTDALVRYFELIAKNDISHIATAEQRGRYQNLLYLRALGEDLNGPPSASRLGYQELKIFFFKICRSSGEKIWESNSSQQVPESYWMINLILTRKGFLQWPEYELGWILRKRKANLNRSAIILFVYLDPELELVGLIKLGLMEPAQLARR